MGIFQNIPGLSWLVSNVYFSILWRSPKGGARILLCAAMATKPKEIVEGGQYLDALCHPLLPAIETDTAIASSVDKITVSLGKSKSLTLYKDPIQALQMADARWSTRLWNVSLSFIEQSPAREVLQWAP